MKKVLDRGMRHKKLPERYPSLLFLRQAEAIGEHFVSVRKYRAIFQIGSILAFIRF